MKVLLLTNEYPPYSYGGAGVHVEYLTQELAKLIDVEVRCFGDQDSAVPQLKVRGYSEPSMDQCPSHLRSIFASSGQCLAMNADGIDAAVVHCHTWYSHLGGIMAKLNYGAKLLVTVHSLEPLRPWKREQLKEGFDFTTWVERTALEMADAIIAVSEGTKKDILSLFNVDEQKIKVIYNGIDPLEFKKIEGQTICQKYKIDTSKPMVLFVGRITRQKGILYLVNAIRHLDPECQVILCAGAPDTPEIAAEMKAVVQEVSSQRDGVVWIEEKLDKPELIALYSQASVFCCPSIYEPFGIINLEAMACQTAVVAAQVGGIPEVVVHEETGLLVPLEQSNEAPYAPIDPEQYARDLAQAVNRLLRDDALRDRFAAAGVVRAREVFSWSSIAAQTVELYQGL